MITLEKDFDIEETYPLSRLGNRDELLFFDIETTGFSGDYHMVYLIGCVYLKGTCAHCVQWFADSPQSEPQVIDSFFSLLENYTALIHFNGDTFDIPFLLKRCRALNLSHDFSGVSSFDIYKRIKPYKKHLGLSSLKQKSIEAFLGISREDMYSGGQLIQVYAEYLKHPDKSLERLLLLHNEDDLKGMPALLPILFYPDFFSQDFALSDMKKTGGDIPRLVLTLCGDPRTILPTAIQADAKAYSFQAFHDTMELSIRLYQGTLKYYYPNYRDYYYLIYEDTAIHKSVGEYVDKDARIKATRETCYTKKSGVFLPQPETVWTPEFKNSCKEKSGFFEFTPDCFSDSCSLNLYIKKIWAELF